MLSTQLAGSNPEAVQGRGFNPDFIDFKVNLSAAWQDAKKRMLDINEGKVDFAYLEANYPRWVENGSFIQADFWFGFDVCSFMDVRY